MEFRLASNNPFVSGMIRCFWGMALVGLLVVVSLYATGEFDGETALISSLFLIAFPAIMMWRFRRMCEGTVKLTGDGLLVEMGGGWPRQAYRWEHIAEVRLTTPADLGTLDRLWAGLCGADENLRLVELRLSRSTRFNVLSDRMGTAVWGVPTLFKTVRLYVVDPEELVRLAQSFLRGPFDAGRI